MLKLISVIIPTHNRSAFLLRAIDSVLAQTLKNYEIIIVDDGSTDNTLVALQSLINAKKIKYFFQENKGVAAARNYGVKQATGEFISFLDSDDEWLPHKLQDQVIYFQLNPQMRIVYGEELWIRNGKRVNQKKIHQKSGGNIFLKCIQQCLIAPSSVMLDKKLFDEMEGFDESFLVCEDYDLWLKISSLMEVGFISKPIIVKYGGHNDQLSTKYVAMDVWRLKALIRILETRNFSSETKRVIVDSIKQRGNILLQGYQKHGNTEGHRDVEAMLGKVLVF